MSPSTPCQLPSGPAPRMLFRVLHMYVCDHLHHRFSSCLTSTHSVSAACSKASRASVTVVFPSQGQWQRCCHPNANTTRFFLNLYTILLFPLNRYLMSMNKGLHLSISARLSSAMVTSTRLTQWTPSWYLTWLLLPTGCPLHPASKETPLFQTQIL